MKKLNLCPYCLADLPGFKMKVVVGEDPDWKSLCAELAAALEKVCKRNDIEEAVLDYYGDCAMALAKYESAVSESE